MDDKVGKLLHRELDKLLCGVEDNYNRGTPEKLGHFEEILEKEIGDFLKKALL